MDIIVAVGEPDGRKANWLEYARFLVGDKKLDTESAGNNSFQDAGKNWSDRNWSEFSWLRCR